MKTMTEEQYEVLIETLNGVGKKIDTLDEKVATLDEKVATLDEKVTTLDKKVTTLEEEFKEFRVDLKYFKSGTQWVVNLAFALIASATVAIWIKLAF